MIHELVSRAMAIGQLDELIKSSVSTGNTLAIAMLFGEVGNAYGKQKKYHTALIYYRKALHLFNQIDDQSEAISYTTARIKNMEDWIGEDFFKELPKIIADDAIAKWQQKDEIGAGTRPEFSISEEFRESLYFGINALLIQLQAEKNEFLVYQQEIPDDLKLCNIIGCLTRKYIDRNINDPNNLFEAARLLNQIDRIRRTNKLIQLSKNTLAGAGPSGGGMGKHVLYLRSFIASPKLPVISTEPWGEIDFEELLACRFDESTLIAIGNNDLLSYGAGKVKTNDDEWKFIIRDLALEAQIILLVPAVTQGTSWEIDWVVTNKFLHKTVFLMPLSEDPLSAWWSKNWLELREWSTYLGLRLPEYSQNGLFFRVGTEGQFDSIDANILFTSGNLHSSLMNQLLFKTNISSDFLYDIKRAANQLISEQSQKNEQSTPDEKVAFTEFELLPELQILVKHIESAPKMDYSNLITDAYNLPNSPGIFIVWELITTPVFAGATSNIAETIHRHSEADLSNDKYFLPQLWQQRIFTNLNNEILQQLLDKHITIQKIVSLKIRQWYSYSFIVVENEEQQKVLLDLIWKGVSKIGVPLLSQPT